MVDSEFLPDEWLDWWDMVMSIDPDTTEDQFLAMWRRYCEHKYRKSLH